MSDEGIDTEVGSTDFTVTYTVALGPALFIRVMVVLPDPTPRT